MNVDLKYLGASEVRSSRSGLAVAFAPNLARPKVFFDAEIGRPLRFREAISALHDVVVGDLRATKRDKAAYHEWRQEQDRIEEELRTGVRRAAQAEALAAAGLGDVPADLDEQFHRLHSIYWRARRQWASELAKHDPRLFRHLVPCDPVVTVAPDVVFFECFSKDESSYGCLSVERNAFTGEQVAQPGTTNVDYSLALYDHFQTLRSYRPSRLLVDPTGFEVRVEGRGDYREEKIDLPPSWLRGFGQLQAAMSLDCTQVEVSREALYSLLVFLKRHRERVGPRAVRFRLTPGRAPVLILDPWGVEIESKGTLYEGVKAEEIRIWGRRRLLVLSRLLPLVDRIDVRLLGTGLPSIWTLALGDMRFTLALSGWTANDWAGSANLHLLSTAETADAQTVDRIGVELESSLSASLDRLSVVVGASRPALLGGLFELARRGQIVYDASVDRYRFRPILPVALSDDVLGPESPEVVEGRRLFSENSVVLLRDEFPSPSRRFVAARVGDTHCEALFDPDGGVHRAKCTCSFFYKSRLRAGLCRHLLALRLRVAS